MLQRAALLPLFLAIACAEPAARHEAAQHAPSRSLAYPVAPAPNAAAEDAGVLSLALSQGRGEENARALRPIDTLKAADIAYLVERAVGRGELPGCVIAVGNHETLLYLQAFGERTQGEPMTLDTHFDLASLTKPIATAQSVMALVEQGVLELDAPVSRYLSELNAPDKRGISVRQLLTHTSGLPRVNPLSAYEQGKAHAIRMIASEPLIDAPGARFEYSDLGFILLGELVERLSGVPLDEYVQKRFFGPLGMRDTRFQPAQSEAAITAPTEERDEKPIRGVVDDPRAYRLGGVAGHAGLFSTASDVARFARMLLRGGELDGVRVLSEDTVSRMLEPRRAGNFRRGLGFDAESPYAHGRGQLFSKRAVGHGGYTGTSVWLDPERDLFVVLLSNRVHSGPQGSIHPLTSSVSDLAVRAAENRPASLYTGIDVLVQSAFADLRGRSVAVLTHAAARDRDGVPTLDRLLNAHGVSVKAVLTPEHGFDAKQEGHVQHQHLGALPMYSLFGKQRKPTPEMLRGVDTVVVDLVDVGTRFYTYMASVLALMESASELGIEVMLLDRPNPIGGASFEGPLSETAFASFVNFHPLPLRHGMTAGELARFLVNERKLPVRLHVVRVENWERDRWFGDTDLVWHAPSPNLGTKEQAMLYPAVALIEGTNVSVGRGTERAFEVIGAPFFDGEKIASALLAANVRGVKVTATRFRPSVGPYAGQLIPGVSLELLEPHTFSAAQLGLTLIEVLRRECGAAWDSTRLDRMVAHRGTLAALADGVAPDQIQASWSAELGGFAAAREKALLY